MKKPIKKETSIKIPVRADIAGGTSDIPYYLDKFDVDCGAVVNISLPVFIDISLAIDETSDQISVSMPDLDKEINGDLKKLELQEKNNACQIISHYLKFFSLEPKGLKVKISAGSKIPPASGLGTSSAIGVGLVIALSDLYGVFGVNPCEFSYLVETTMGILGGKQDYYAAWLGGLNYLKFDGPKKSLVTIKKSFDTNHSLYKWVMKRMVVYYTGHSRSSGKMNAQFRERIAKNPSIFSAIAYDADTAFKAIKGRDEKALARAINSDREHHLDLSQLYYSSTMNKMVSIGEKLGFAHRGCGAGGGGSILFFGGKNNHDKLIGELNKIKGYQIC